MTKEISPHLRGTRLTLPVSNLDAFLWATIWFCIGALLGIVTTYRRVPD